MLRKKLWWSAPVWMVAVSAALAPGAQAVAAPQDAAVGQSAAGQSGDGPAVAVAVAGEDAVSDARSRIHEQTVRSTVAFLASDELGGRGTPSPGFTIASAYVASRFAGAGLKPAGVDGTWYQNSEIGTLLLPRDGIVFQTEAGESLPQAGLLAAGDEVLDFSGVPGLVDLKEEYPPGKFSGAVVAEVGEGAGNQRFLSSLARGTNRLAAAGATALLLVVPEGHVTRELAREWSEIGQVDNQSRRLALPVLLVPAAPPAGAAVRLSLPPVKREAAVVRNVIGVLEGSDPALADQAILVTAHLDHLGVKGGTGDRVYNGADDDASGVTAVLTLADAFAALPQRPARSVLFVTYWGEEQGLLGSRQFAAEPTWPLEKIVANINIEMIGRPEPGAAGKIWVTGWSESTLGPLMQEAAKAKGGVIFEHPQFSAMLYRASDNWSLAEKGVVAHSFSAGSLHEDYHQLGDEWQKLDVPHMTRVIGVLFDAMQPLASGTVTPEPAAGRRPR